MFDELFTKVEKAIDAHPSLSRVGLGNKAIDLSNLPKPTMIHEPKMVVTRGWFVIEILVKLKGSRKRPTEIWGRGETPEEAVEELIDSLDHWVTAIK